jgi:serine/threonine protein kinase/tetratricopeptide (TPR) repeat protein
MGCDCSESAGRLRSLFIRTVRRDPVLSAIGEITCNAAMLTPSPNEFNARTLRGIARTDRPSVHTSLDTPPRGAKDRRERGLRPLVDSAMSFGPYRVLDEISRGGMGVVYRARHAENDRTVAVKSVVVPEPQWIESLRREIDALTRMRHPGIVRILDHGVQHGLPWYAMDLLEGERLRELLWRIWSPYRPRPTALGIWRPLTETAPISGEAPGRPPNDDASSASPRTPGVPPVAAGVLPQVLALMRRLCATLAFLHGEGFVSCDVKPENVIVVGVMPVLIDFGIATRFPSAVGREAIDDRDGRHGTSQYMSPEHLRRELVDARSDLYSLGCVLYELLTGTPPFVGPTFAIRNQHLTVAPVAPSEIVQGVPPALERLVLRLLAKEPSDRVGFADEVAGILAEIAGDAEPLRDFPPVRPYLYRPRLVGRADASETLLQLRNGARQGQGAIAVLAGESGVGKTRLALELSRTSAALGVSVVASQFDSPGPGQAPTPGSSPFQCVKPLLRAIADRCRKGGPEVTARLLGAGRSVLALYEPLVADVPSYEPMEPVVPLPPDASRRRLLRYAAESLAAFAQETPLLWILDDLGWADDLSLSFVQSLTPDFLSAAPLLLLATYRSEEANDAIQELAVTPHVVKIVLPRLDAQDVRRMVADMLALPSVDAHFASYVAASSEGNPFFVTEHVRSAVAEQIFFRDQSHAWRTVPAAAGENANYETLPLPRSLQELIDRRLRSLSPIAQHAVIAAAVLGRESAADIVVDVAALSTEAGSQAIDELIRRQILEHPAPDRLRFVHDKLREVAYAGAADRLRVLHARAAASIEQRAAGCADAAESWAPLGQHFAAAGLPRPAARYLQRAADRARATFANADAIALYRRALGQAHDVSPTDGDGDAPAGSMLIELNEALGDVLALVGRREEARAAYVAAVARLPVGDNISLARLYRKNGNTSEAEGDHERALEFYGRARSTLPPEVPDGANNERDEWIHARFDEMRVYYWLNRRADMDAVVSQLGPVVEIRGTPTHLAGFYQSQLFHRLARDRYAISDDTLALSDMVLRACGVEGAPERAWAHFQRGFALLLTRGPAEAEVYLEDGLRFADRAGDIVNQARCALYLAVAARIRGDVEAVRRRCESTASISKAAGMLQYVAASRALAAWVALQRGDVDGALHLTDIALQGWASYRGVYPFHWLGLVPRLEAQLTRGMLAGAVECCRALLHPDQRQLPVAVEERLRESISASDRGDVSATRIGLEDSLRALGQHSFR